MAISQHKDDQMSAVTTTWPRVIALQIKVVCAGGVWNDVYAV